MSDESKKNNLVVSASIRDFLKIELICDYKEFSCKAGVIAGLIQRQTIDWDYINPIDMVGDFAGHIKPEECRVMGQLRLFLTYLKRVEDEDFDKGTNIDPLDLMKSAFDEYFQNRTELRNRINRPGGQKEDNGK